jgi:hypothetical protein
MTPTDSMFDSEVPISGTPGRWNVWWLVPIALIASILVGYLQFARHPSHDEWRAASEWVSEEVQEGDGVAWIPYWVNEVRLFTQGQPTFHLVDPMSDDLARHRRVWLFGSYGWGPDDLAAPFDLIATRQFGAVQVSLLAPTGERVVADLRRNLDKAEFTRTRAKHPDVSCDIWDGQGWHCPPATKSRSEVVTCLSKPYAERHRDRSSKVNCWLNKWFHVSRDARKIGGWPRRGIWFHPQPPSQVEVTWRDLDKATDLVIDYGLSDRVVLDTRRETPRVRPMTLEVVVNDEVVDSKSITVQPGWRRWRISVPDVPIEALTLRLSGSSHLDAHLLVDPTLRRER